MALGLWRVLQFSFDLLLFSSEILFSEICESVPMVCEIILNAIAGWDMENLNKSRTDIYVQCPDTWAVKVFLYLHVV